MFEKHTGQDHIFLLTPASVEHLPVKPHMGQ